MDQEILRLQEKCNACHQKIIAYQARCMHPPAAIRYLHDSSTGGWDSGSDSYWTNFYCTKCGKSWLKEGSIRVPGGFRINYTHESLIPEGSCRIG